MTAIFNNNHQLCLDTLVSREIMHLGNTSVKDKGSKDKLKEKFHDDDFIAMVRQLFIKTSA